MLTKVIQFVLKLGIIPKGWMTYLTGLAAILMGAACMVGASPTLGLPCPDDPWTLLLGGLAAIGIRRHLDAPAPK